MCGLSKCEVAVVFVPDYLFKDCIKVIRWLESDSLFYPCQIWHASRQVVELCLVCLFVWYEDFFTFALRHTDNLVGELFDGYFFV